MNIREIFELEGWYREYVSPIIPYLEDIASILENNSKQINKKELVSRLDRAINFLTNVPTHLLDLQQIEFLEINNVRELLGIEGAIWLEDRVNNSGINSEKAAQGIRSALTSLSSVYGNLNNLTSSFIKLGLKPKEVEDDGGIIVRLRFDGKSGINNVSDLKKQSSDWYEIIRAISGSVGEAPEQTRIVGASTGSIILVLSATAAAATVLAVISKKLTSVVTDGIALANAMEDLKHKKIINRAIEQAIKDQQKLILSKGIDEAVSAVKALPITSDMNIENETALVSAVKKIANFQDNGGDIDMIAPSHVMENNSDRREDFQAILNTRENIIGMQAAREKMRNLQLLNQIEGNEEEPL